MRLKVLMAVALLVSGGARAAGITLTWTAPTRNTDGTPLTNLASYLVEWSICNADGTFGATGTGSLTVPASATTAAIAKPPTGKVCARVSAKNSLGVFSDPSATVSKVWLMPAPTNGSVVPAPKNGSLVH
jgi:hypothetical protein